MKRSKYFAPLVAASTVWLGGCTSADPTAPMAATAELLAERGVSAPSWARDDPARNEAVAASRALLARPLDSATAAEVALLRNAALQAALAELGVAQADLAQASRLANPGVSFTRLTGEGETKRTGGLMADVVDWLTRPLRRRIAAAELERVKLSVGGAIFDLVATAKQALVDYQAARATADLLAQHQATERAAADYAEALRQAGNATRREQALAEAAWLDRRAASEAGEAACARAREALVRALGIEADEPWSVAPLAPPPPLPVADAAVLEAIARRQRLDVAAARWAVAVLERARDHHRKTRWLPVGVELGMEREREVDGVRLEGPTVSLALPIFDAGGATRARYEAEIARAQAQLAVLDQRARSETREATSALAAATARAALWRDTVLPLRRQVLELTVRESNQMLVGAFEVLAAKQAVLEAEQGQIDAVADAWAARVELERALGVFLERLQEIP